MLINRRALIKRLLATSALVPVFSALTACGEKAAEKPVEPVPPPPSEPVAPPPSEPVAPPPSEPAAGGGLPDGLPALEESDPVATGLGYKDDLARFDVSKMPNKPPEGVTPNCMNCALFSATSDANWGKCSIFPGKLVKPNASCNSWSPKAS